MSLKTVLRPSTLVLLLLAALHISAQQKTLEERQTLELVFADSIVPQDRHETMLTTGGVPIGLTSATERAGGVIKFTFELGREPD